MIRHTGCDPTQAARAGPGLRLSEAPTGGADTTVFSMARPAEATPSTGTIHAASGNPG